MKFKSSLLEVIVIAVLIAVGASLIASGISTYFINVNYLSFICGMLFVCLGILILLRRINPKIIQKKKIEALVSLDKENYRIAEIEKYKLSEELHSYTEGLFQENDALRKLWNKEPPSCIYDFKDGKTTIRSPKGNDLLTQAVEYYVLNKLSLHLSSYFNGNHSINEELTETHERENIPHILLTNKYLEHFSKPMEERTAFALTDDAELYGRIIFASGKNGEIYEHFELTLPKGSIVSRSELGFIKIKTKRFTLSFKATFDGMGGTLPFRFNELYMNKSWNETSEYTLHINIEVSFNKLYLFSSKGWEYYHWVDSFIEELEKEAGKNNFLERINWNSNYTIIKIMENLKNQTVNK